MDNRQQSVDAAIAAIKDISVVPTILEVICRTTGMGFAAVARVTDERWIVCAVQDEMNFGLEPGGELKLETTICNEIRQHHEPVVIDHVAQDDKFCGHHTPAMYGFQSYISFPIVLKDGSFFGTLCAIDPKPALLNNIATRGMFKLFADLLALHLNAQADLHVTKRDLIEERKISETREEFIAILGHDLRNPVSAILSSAQLLQTMPIDPASQRLVTVIQNSTRRMSGLIDNILDFARGRLGDGIVLNKEKDCDLQKALFDVVVELQVSYPGREIETHFHLTKTMDCDATRIAQLFANLLGNALKFGNPADPIRIRAFNNSDELKLSVANTGRQISASALERLFQPFTRGEFEPHQQGLGLGLYISSQIARAHGGSLEVSSTPEETVFTFTMKH